ncbi:MAG: tRNA lysidine(34) synthetase TilS [Xanthomonadaceae bacterium]|nr:tRNA lysidine(34) synthetase TilS [Xanthomonadaceae bacterium]
MSTAAALGPEALWQRLPQPHPAAGYCVAYSGGRDSHVLLHLVAALRPRLGVPVRALHVHHGLQAPADDWVEHCRRICRELGIPLQVERVQCRAGPGISIEEAAREARYAAYERHLKVGEVLLLAHHQDDQIETLLLRLLRGAGVHGLAAMPPSRPLGRGLLLRPLLDVPLAAIAAYAEAQGLSWVEDPSNRDDAYDRNFLRNRLLPLLAERWPGYARPLQRAAALAREAADLLDALAEQDLRQCAAGDGLDLEALRLLTEPRQRNLLRCWLRRQGLRPPARERLQAGLKTLLEAAPDRSPELAWDGVRLRRYRNRLLLDTEPEEVPAPFAWDLASPLELPGWRWQVESVIGAGLRAALRQRRVEVRFRQGGERCRLAGERHSRSLKKLLQERGIPPWERERLPLIYIDGELAAVADLWVCDGFQAAPGEAGLRLVRIEKNAPFC